MLFPITELMLNQLTVLGDIVGLMTTLLLGRVAKMPFNPLIAHGLYQADCVGSQRIGTG
ncbi:hypothetical protein [Gynuella sp.]|uniref:hypothetical protein n=1 Tax=Gynuella sp. TaxID=2969146 RepID=UPI003D110C50